MVWVGARDEVYLSSSIQKGGEVMEKYEPLCFPIENELTLVIDVQKDDRVFVYDIEGNSFSKYVEDDGMESVDLDTALKLIKGLIQLYQAKM